MAFMTARVSDTQDYFLISEDLEECIFCKYNGIDLPVGTYTDDMDPPDDEELAEAIAEVFKEFPNISQFEIVYQYWGQLSASGYMDQTDYFLGDTQAEVAQQLLDMYFDGDDEYMDNGQRADRDWLESIVEGKAYEARFRLFYEAYRRIADRNNAFMDLVTDEPNPMTKQDLEGLISRWPEKYGMFAELLKVLPDEVQP